MRHQRGFTLIEVMIALVILTVVALSLGRFVASFSHTVGTSTAQTTAVAVAQERLDSIRAASTISTYPNLVALFNGNSVTGFPGYPNMTRVTVAVRTQSVVPKRDYTTITVTVTEPTMGPAVNLTNLVASP